jgi:uncharacterized membrane protein
LVNLLSADAPAGATLHSAEWTLRGLLPLWVAGLLALGSFVAVFALYRKEAVRQAWRKWAMAALRVALVGLLLVLLLRPVLVAEFRGERPRTVAVLVDRSLSMGQRDQRLTPADRWRVALAEDKVAPDGGGKNPDSVSLAEVPSDATENPSRIDVVKAVLKNPRLRLLAGLDQAGPVRFFLFGTRLEAVPPNADQLTTLLTAAEPKDTTTALTDAIQEVLQPPDADPPAAIVVITDGRDNASQARLDDVARACAAAKVPLHLYGVGAVDIGNLSLKELAVPDLLFAQDTAAVLVRWRCQGFKQGKAEITLRLDGQPVARKEVDVKVGEDFQEVLTFPVPETGGGEKRRDLTATIRYQGPEVFLDDNEAKQPVRITDRKVKVLYVESQPRWEYKFLMTALLRDKRVEARFLLVNGDPRALQGGPPYLTAFPPTRADLFAYDLIILGDVAADYLGAEKQAWLRDFVSEGGGLVLIAGPRNAPFSYRNTPLAEALPVELGPEAPPVEGKSQAYIPVLTRAGERSELLALADTPEESRKIWKELPGFFWYHPVMKLRPGAVTLLGHPSATADGQPLPLMATQAFGKGQVLYLGTDETWRWRFNARERYFGRFWGQVVYQLGLPHLIGGPRRVQWGMDRTENVIGQPTFVHARLLDREYRPLTQERVTARLEPLDGGAAGDRSRPIVFDAVGGQPGQYRATLPNDTAGRWVLKLDDPEPAALEFRVGYPPHHELAVAGLADGPLREAARLSGGQFYREESLHKLAGNLVPQAAPFAVRQEIVLWNGLAFWLFVLVITAEWVFRKFSHLS